jgi:hypothetical protein
MKISVQNLYLLGYYSPEQYESEIAKIENIGKMILMSLDEEIIRHHLCPDPGAVVMS